MSDTESMSSDNSDNELFTEEFLENIPEDSDSSDNENNESYFNNTSYNTELNSTLRLEVGLTFLTWKAAFEYIKKWAHEQGFYVRKERSEKIESKRRKQIILCYCEGHFGHVLDPLACRFDADKAFTKPMLEDIEWMCLYGRLKPLEIKRMLKAKYNRKVYNQDLYKVIYKYRNTKDQLGNDVLRLLVHLEKCKDDDC
ncbi:unnamed protein product [Rhizophagus irregularis]|nr:unnamed protein product [Rhizophagus irregularis]